MNIEPPAMPYDFADLEPAMSRDTLVFHFLRHQRVCFDRMLTMVRGSELEALPLDELIRVTERVPAQHALFRYAAEVWNHNLFWRSMRPRGGGAAYGAGGELGGAGRARARRARDRPRSPERALTLLRTLAHRLPATRTRCGW